ncbi:MAG TPA: DUF1553 domain-containing protein [Nitrospirales bacterium]|nr:DUF1553 domain-containing protein [Nitrospirales bacterium]
MRNDSRRSRRVWTGEQTEFGGDHRPDAVDFALHLVGPTHPLFSRTKVNRIWNRYLGRGISEPRNDFRFDILPNHNEYDIKWVVRRILTSAAYQRGYYAKMEDASLRTNNTDRHYRSPALRRMTAEQFVDSARKVLGIPYEAEYRSYRETLISPLQQSLGRKARSQVITTRSHDAGVVQALEIINGESLNSLIYESEYVQKESKKLSTPEGVEEIISDLYWESHSRSATRNEIVSAQEYVSTLLREGDVGLDRILGDLYWAHLMSPYFLFVL